MILIKNFIVKNYMTLFILSIILYFFFFYIPIFTGKSSYKKGKFYSNDIKLPKGKIVRINNRNNVVIEDSAGNFLIRTVDKKYEDLIKIDDIIN